MQTFDTADERHDIMNEISSSPDRNGHQMICRYYVVKPELCAAAISSAMVDRLDCVTGRYKNCAIFFVNTTKKRA